MFRFLCMIWYWGKNSKNPYIQKLFRTMFNVVQSQRKKLILRKLSKSEHEYGSEIRFVEKNSHMHAFPYDWSLTYNQYPVEVIEDSDGAYVFHQNKKLYLKPIGTDISCADIYRQLLMEQDKRSPHYYRQFYPDFSCKACFMDIGCAEAMSTLEIIDDIDHAVLFEADVEWLPALKKTFAPYGDKIAIVSQFVGNTNSERFTTLDAYVQDHEQLFNQFDQIVIKIDVEGAEMDVLKGAKKLLQSGKKIIVICCTYHRSRDGYVIGRFFDRLNYAISYSPGYMIFDTIVNDPFLRKPIFRRGLICAEFDLPIKQ